MNVDPNRVLCQNDEIGIHDVANHIRLHTIPSQFMYFEAYIQFTNSIPHPHLS